MEKVWSKKDYFEFAEAYATQKAQEIKLALDKGKNVLCPSAAGTGKSYAVTRMLDLLGYEPCEYILVAFTGIAACNINASTINSALKFPPVGRNKMKPGESVDDYVERASNAWLRRVKTDRKMKEIKEQLTILKLMVNDEVSMTSGIFLRFMDRCFRKFRKCDDPFGGIRMIFLGDMLQLAPCEDLCDSRKTPDYCYPYLGDFERIMFDFGHRYMVHTPDSVVEQVGFWKFLANLRYGDVYESEFMSMGFTVLTEEEYKANLSATLPDGTLVDRLMLSQTNRKVDSWNDEINELYKDKVPLTRWRSDVYRITSSSRTGSCMFNAFGLSDSNKRAMIVAAIRGNLISLPTVFEPYYDEYMTRGGDATGLEFKHYLLSAFEESKDVAKDIIDTCSKLLHACKLTETERTRLLRDKPAFLGTYDGENPISIPHAMELRKGGPVLIRANKPDGIEELANGSLLSFERINEKGQAVVKTEAMDGVPAKEYKLGKMLRFEAVSEHEVYVTFQYPFMQADAITAHKAQSLTLSKMGFLLGGAFRNYCAQYVIVSRVRNPRKFMYVVPKYIAKSCSTLEEALSPETQKVRLKKVYREIRDLTSVHPDVYDTVLEWEES